MTWKASDPATPTARSWPRCRDAESRGLDVEAVFPKLVAARTLDDADDLAAVLHGRVDRWATAAGSRRQAVNQLIAGLIPRATGITDPDMAQALTERDRAWNSERDTSPNTPRPPPRLGPAARQPTPEPSRPRSLARGSVHRRRVPGPLGIGNDHRPLGTENAVKSVEGSATATEPKPPSKSLYVLGARPARLPRSASSCPGQGS